MATGVNDGQLTNPQIVRLASAISAKDMAAIAEGYMDIDDAAIKILESKHKYDAGAFNREIIRYWTRRNPDKQIQVIYTGHLMGNVRSILKGHVIQKGDPGHLKFG